MKKSLLVTILLFLITACGSSDSELPAFKVAVIPAQSTGVVEEGYRRLEQVLSNGLNRDVELQIYPNYNAVVEAINYKHVDLAFLGPTTYLIAHEQSGAEAIATPLINGEPYYYSYIITHADSPWDSLDELIQEVENVDFAFGNISSTSGSIIPSYELLQRDAFRTEDDHNFKSIIYTGSHDVTAIQVGNKLVDAGAIDSAIFHSLINNGDIEESDYKIIWCSEQIYQYPWVVPADTDSKLIEQLQSVFLDITDIEILSVFGGASGFVVSEPEKYQSILDAIYAVRPEMLNPKE